MNPAHNANYQIGVSRRNQGAQYPDKTSHLYCQIGWVSEHTRILGWLSAKHNTDWLLGYNAYFMGWSYSCVFLKGVDDQDATRGYQQARLEATTMRCPF
jgi:hypothetical protein